MLHARLARELSNGHNIKIAWRNCGLCLRAGYFFPTEKEAESTTHILSRVVLSVNVLRFYQGKTVVHKLATVNQIKKRGRAEEKVSIVI